MNDIIYKLFGEGKELNALQMGCRAFVLFFITLFLIRVAGMRAFGQKSAFDTIIVILLGAILSRAVTGASAFWPIITAGTVLAIVHRLLALASMYYDSIGAIVKGSKTVLYKNKKFFKKNMIKCSISYKDLEEEVRLIMNDTNMDNVEEINMERSGKMSIIKKTQDIHH